jgi:PPP family 3-phenylpropionic acid transporter
MAQTTEVAALALVQPLHGFTFALLHLATIRLITDTVRSDLAGTAQAIYGPVGVGGATAVPFQDGFISVSGRPDFWRWVCFALLLFLSSGLCIGRFSARRTSAAAQVMHT